MDLILEFIQNNKAYIDVAHALSIVVNLVGWSLGFVLLFVAWRNKAIKQIAIGPFSFQMQAAVEAAAAATRDWQSKVPAQKVDVPKIRETISHAFTPEAADRLVGRSVLWVDDNPRNNRLAVRAFGKLGLDVEQVNSTEAALSALEDRRFDLIISDMGRGREMTAGYKLLEAIRAQPNDVPFFIFAGSESASLSRAAHERGAQLSTNDILKLIDATIDTLGKA